MKRTSIGRRLSLGIVMALIINLLYGMTGVEAAGTFQVSLKQPLNGAKGISVDTSQIQLEFGREVKLAGGTIIVKKENSTDSADVIVTKNITAQDFTINRYDIDLPLGGLQLNTKYQITGEADIFVDANDSSMKSETINLGFTTISQIGSTNPKIDTATDSLLPAAGSTISGSSTSTTLSVTFDKQVIKGTGNIYVKRASTNQSVTTLAVGQPEVVLSNNDKTASFVTNNLMRGERYYVLMDPGTFKDADDHTFEGISLASKWYFNVQGPDVKWDATAPTVPAAGATGVAPTGSIQLNFSRPVYPIAGKIRLELSSTGTLVKEYDVTSAEVSGGGTNKVSLVLPSLSYNTGYAVKVPAGVFEDSDHKVTEEKNWSFTTGNSASTTLVPSFYPTDRSANNAVTVTPVVTFNRNIRLNNMSGVRLYKQGTSSPIEADVYVSLTNPNQLIIDPKNSLQDNSTYYVEITNNAITDLLTGAYYSGLSGTSSWTFQTLTLDKTAPVLQSATMYSNSVIRLMYNETLDSSISLLTSSFTVTVNGEARRLSSVYTSGESAYVTLETGVAVGQKVTISYSGNSLRPIRDVAGNSVVSFTSKDVTNGIDSVLPKPRDGYVSGSTLTLYFSESLKSVSSYAYQQFTVTADGYSKGINSISQSGSTVTLYLSSSVSNGEVIKVSYSPGSYPLQDTRGQNISAFNDYFVRNYSDNKSPEFTSVEGSGNKIVLTYNEALRTTNIPLKSQFSVLVNNLPVYVTNVEVVGNQVLLTLASSFTQTQNVTLSYVSGVGGTADLNGNLAGYIDRQPVTYSLITEGIRSGIVRGDTITVTFTETLTNVSNLPTSEFFVTVDQKVQEIQSASISGDTLTIKLNSVVSGGQTVKLSYMAGASPLLNQTGTRIKNFSEMPLQNLTGTTSGSNTNVDAPSFLTTLNATEYGINGYVMGSTTATITGGKSKQGQVVKQYNLDSSKVADTLKYFGNSYINNRLAVFEVPSTEKAAQVVIPMGGLMEFYNSGKTGSFGVRYGNTLYELPVEKIPFSEIAQSLRVNSPNNVNLMIQLEPVLRNQLFKVSSGKVTLTQLIDPIQIDVSVFSGSSSINSVGIEPEGRIHLRLTGQASIASQASMINYDLGTNTALHLPSTATSSGTSLLFDGTTKGNSLVGLAIGYSNYGDTTRHWAKNDIIELSNKLIVEPRSNAGSNFEPDKSITRAEFAVFIAKGLGLAGDEANARRFPDVSSGTTAAFIGAAAKAGIINGNADGTFKPNSNITREQMALMMVRAMEYAGYDTSMNGASTATLTKFKDAAKIQSKDTVAKAVKEGIIQGVTTNTFQPQGNATRAQAAVMLKRVLDKLNYI
ncbi:SwmB domain-containing protein [Paenibacillus rhizolycopersici]|nr:SwmB domain-containing protein [Paenibacillus rhizolycopersici]